MIAALQKDEADESDFVVKAAPQVKYGLKWHIIWWACVRTQMWNRQEAWRAQQEARRRKLHQRCEQGAGLHGCQGIFTVGHDLQAFSGQVKSITPDPYVRVPGSLWLSFSLFYSKKRQEDQWDTRQGLPLCAAH